MAPSQRLTLLVLPVVLVGAFGMLMYSNSASSDVALSWGKVFTSAELSAAQQTLRDANLNDFRTDGQRIMVPSQHVDSYNAALLEGGALPNGFASELEKQLDKDGIFVGDKQRRERKHVAMQRALSKMITAIEDIEHAEVVWSQPEARIWRRSTPKIKATVFVRPRGGRILPQSLIEGVRSAIAGVIDGLSPFDVVVMDQVNRKTYKPDSQDDPFSSRMLNLTKAYTEEYSDRINGALDFIDDVIVTVNVKLDPLLRHDEQSRQIDPKKVVVVRQQETKNNRTSSQERPSIEPGVVSNQGNDVAAATGNKSSLKTTSSETDVQTVPSVLVEQKQTIGNTPQEVHVSVQIPYDYYRNAAAKKVTAETGLTENAENDADKQKFLAARDAAIKTMETTVKADVTAIVAKAIGSNQPENTIQVSSYTLLDQKPSEVETSIVETVGNVTTQWGSAVALAAFAFWALWMLNRSTPQAPAELPKVEEPTLTLHKTKKQEEEVEEVPKGPTERDKLQNIVRDNPEVAASVIGRWLRD